MNTIPDLGHAVLFARTELRRTWRRLSDNPLQMLALAIAGLFVLLLVVVMAVAAYFIGQGFADGSLDIENPVSAAASVAAGLWLIVTFLVTFRTVAERASLDNADGLLTTAPYPDIVVGVILTELAGLLAYGGVPTLAVAVAFGLGAGSLTSTLLMLLTLLAVATTGLLVGFALGFGIRNVTARSELVARHRTAIWLVAIALYAGVFLTGSQASVFAPVVAVFSRPPLAWYGDLALLAATSSANPTNAALAAGLTVIAIPALTAVVVRLAGLLWYADPATSETESGSATSGLAAAATGGFEGWVARPVAWVARKSWLRAARAPIKLAFVLYPVFLLAGPITEAIETGSVPASLPALFALYGAWATGAAFTLNPLGDEGAVLPVALTSGLDGWGFVAGLVLAGVALGVPVTAALTLLAGLLSPLSVVAAAVLALVAIVLCAGAAGLATGIGTAFPRFEAASITRSREAVVPSLLAFAIYSLVLLVAAAPGIVLQMPLAAEALADAASASVLAARVVGAALTVAIVGVAGWVSVRYAARSFDHYTL